MEGHKTMTVYITQDTRARLKLIKESVNRLQMLNANNCKSLFTREEVAALVEQIKETRERIHTQKMKAPIKALIKGDYNCKESSVADNNEVRVY